MSKILKRTGRIPILYIHNSALIGGGNNALLGLFDQLVSSEFQPVSVLSGPGPMEDQLRRRGIPYVVVALQEAVGCNVRLTLRAIVDLMVCMLRYRIKLMHANGPTYYRAASIAARYMKVRRVCHLQFPPESTELSWAFKFPPEVVIPCSVHLGREMKAKIGLLGLPTDVTPVPNAADLCRFTPPTDIPALRTRFALEGYSHLVTIVGLVSERKGHRFFLEMAKEVLRGYPQAGFIVVGEDILQGGAYRRTMEQYASDLGIAKQVLFMGFREDTSDLIGASDVIVLPSLQEGQPLSLVEAQACGKPVVATTVDGIPEVVEDGVTGLLVPPKDVAALSAAVLRLLRDEGLRRSMGAAGRIRTVKFFSAQAHADKVQQIYRRLLLKNDNVVAELV